MENNPKCTNSTLVPAIIWFKTNFFCISVVIVFGMNKDFGEEGDEKTVPPTAGAPGQKQSFGPQCGAPNILLLLNGEVLGFSFSL